MGFKDKFIEMIREKTIRGYTDDIFKYNKKSDLYKRLVKSRFERIGEASNFNLYQSLGVFIAMILVTLTSIFFLYLTAKIILAIYTALGIWYVVGAFFLLYFIKTSFKVFKQLIT